MTENDKAPERDSGNVESGPARHGHVSYLEIPALDTEQSAAFYETVFGWHIRRRAAGHSSFDDRSGALIGGWVTGRVVSREPGLLPFIYVDGIDEIVEWVVTQGGEIVKPPYPEGDLWVATFRDPAGNVMGVWQAGPR
jgi:predicted enzyme related to lactoylglutathione lyase